VRIQQHDYPEDAGDDCPCAVPHCPVLKRDSARLTCIFREAPASSLVRPNPSPVFGYPNIDLDSFKKILEEGDAALNHVDPELAS
jgi:hypothetical protein